MAVHSVRARDFWHQLEQQKTIDEPDFFQRAAPFRNSLKSNELQPLNATLHGPVWASVYCTSKFFFHLQYLLTLVIDLVCLKISVTENLICYFI